MPSLRLAPFQNLIAASLLAGSCLCAASAQATAPPLALGNATIGNPLTGTVTFTFSGSTPVASIAVVTQGTPNLDFTLNTASSGSCSPQTYSSGASCTVGIKFTPTAAGLRLGGVQLLDTSSNILASAIITGTVIGGELTANTTALTPLSFGSFTNVTPFAAVADAAGNVYVTDTTGKQLLKIAAATGTVTSCTCGLTAPKGVAVGGDGYVYVADYLNGTTDPVVRINMSLATPTYAPLNATFGTPTGLLFDSAGNLYVTGTGSAGTTVITGSTSTTTGAYPGITTVTPAGVASAFSGVGSSDPIEQMVFDNNGNAYIVEYNAGSVLKIAKGSTSASIYASFANATGIAIDLGGNLFVQSPTTLSRIPSGSTTVSTYTTGYTTARSLGMDSNGNIFTADLGARKVYEIARNPVTLIFPDTTAVNATSSAQSLTFTNTGNNPSDGTSSSTTGHYTVTSDNCLGYNMFSGTCTISATFSPMAHGSPQLGSLVVAGTFSPVTINFTAYVTGDPTIMSFSTAPPASVAAGGNAGSIVVAFKDNAGNPATSATGTATLTVTAAGYTTQTYTTTPSATTGLATFNTSSNALTLAGTYTYTVTYTGLSTISTIESVTPGPATVLKTSLANASPYTGVPDNITVTAYDQYANVATSNTDTVALSTSPATSTLPANFALAEGTATQPVIFNMAGTYTLTATDQTNATITPGTSGNIAVQPIPSFLVTTVNDDPGTTTAANCPNQSVTPLPAQPNPCSLRDAIAATNALGFTGETGVQPVITFLPDLYASGPALFRMAGSAITPTANFSLAGPGAANILITPTLQNTSFMSTSTASIAMTISGVTLQQFMLTNTNYNGGAWTATGAGHLTTFNNVVFNGNSAPSNSLQGEGGAVYELNGELIIAGSTFLGNSGSEGGAVYAAGATSVSITNSIFGSVTSPNSASYGGALYLTGNGGAMVMSGNTFTANTAAQYGGAMYISGNVGTPALPATGNVFTGNKVTSEMLIGSLGGGGAIFIAGASVLNLNLNSFTGNSVAGIYALGGALSIYSSGAQPNVTVTNSLFSGNQAAATTNNAYGGAISQAGGSTGNLSILTLTGDTFTANNVTAASTSTSSPAEGGAIYTGTNVMDTFSNDTFTANRATNTKTAGYAHGGGIYSAGTGSFLPALANTIVAANTTSGTYPDVFPSPATGTCPAAYCNGTSATSTVDGTILLSTPGSYGGPLQTILPLPGSTALAATTGCTQTGTDARGYPRSITYNGTTYCDAGAAQSNYSLSFITQPSNTAINTALLPPPTLQVYESGTPFGGTGGTLTLTASAGTPSLTSLATTASGLINVTPTFPTPENADRLIAIIPGASSNTVANATSSPFNITNASGTSSDMIWLLSANGTSSTLSDAGVPGTTGIGTANAASAYGGIAFDSAGNAWSVSSGANLLQFANSSGSASPTITGGGLNAPTALAVDGAGSLWIANSSGNIVSEFNNSGTAITSNSGYGSSDTLSAPSAIAIDFTGGVWVASKSGNSITHIFGAASPVITPLSTATASNTLGTRP